MEEQKFDQGDSPREPAALRLRTLSSHPLEDLSSSPLSDDGNGGQEDLAVEPEGPENSLAGDETREARANGEHLPMRNHNDSFNVEGQGGDTVLSCLPAILHELVVAIAWGVAGHHYQQAPSWIQSHASAPTTKACLTRSNVGLASKKRTLLDCIYNQPGVGA